MELNEPFEGHEHATVSMKVVLLMFAIVVIGALSYFVWAQNTAVDSTDYSTPKVTTKTTQKTETTAAAKAVACGDTKLYGFSLTFGNLWTGHKIKEVHPTDAIITCYFELLTSSTDDVWATATADHDAKYASLFAVSVYTPTQFTASQAEANKPTKLGANANYVWAWSPAQAYPTDLAAAGADAKNVVATFAIAS